MFKRMHVAAGIIILLLSPSVWAALGAPAASVEQDNRSLNQRSSATLAKYPELKKISAATDVTATVKVAAASGTVSSKASSAKAPDATKNIPASTPAYQVKQFTEWHGTQVREYIVNGTVVGVAWQGPWIPNLSVLLGQKFFALYEADVAQQLKTRAVYVMNRVRAQAGGMVVDSVGRSPHFTGRAFLPASLPAGMQPADIR